MSGRLRPVSAQPAAASRGRLGTRIGARARWIAVQLRRLTDARAATASLVGLVLVTSFLFGAAPRLTERQSNDALATTVMSADAGTRNIAVEQTGRLGEGTEEPLTIAETNAPRFEEQFPASVAGLVAARYLVVDTTRYIPYGLEYRTLKLRYQEGAENHVHLVSGRFPTGNTGTMPIPEGMSSGPTNLRPGLIPAPQTDLTTFEVALSTASAAGLGVNVGDMLALSSDTTDQGGNQSVALIGITVVGLFETNDVNEDYWFADTSLDRPQARSQGLTDIDDMTALISRDAYKPLLQATIGSFLPFRFAWRYELDPERLRTADTSALLPDLRRMESVFAAAAGGGGSASTGSGAAGPITLQTGLVMLIGQYVTSWRAVSEASSILAVGAGAVALLGLGLLCLLAGRRRRPSAELWLSRGASPRQFLAGLLAEAVTVVVPPAIVGTALSVATIPGTHWQPTIVAAGGVVLFAIALLVWDGRAGGRDPATAGGPISIALGSQARAAGGRGIAGLTRGASPRRLVLEGAIVVAAIAGAYILRQRGVAAAGASAAGAGASATTTSPDLVSAAIPVLILGAGALVAVRLLPLPLDLFSRIAERGRGLVAVLALRRATRRTNDWLLLTSLLTMAAVWSFAFAALSCLDRAASVASWQEVGAAFRVALREGALPAQFSLDGVAGIEKTAYATELTGHVTGYGVQASVVALDLADYEAVVAGGWPESLIPQSMLAAEVPAPPLSPVPSPTPAPSSGPAASGQSPAQSPVPVIVSTAFADQDHLKAGDIVSVVVTGASVNLSVAAVLDSFPTLDAGTNWIVAGRGSLTAAVGAEVPSVEALAPTEAFVRAPESAAADIAATAQYQLPGRLLFTNRYQVEAGLRDSAGFSSAISGMAAASVVVAAYGALAILAALLLAGTERSREAAHLLVLGVNRRQEALLGALEHGPAALLMIVAGIALGIGLFALLLPALGLASLVGGQVDVSVSVGPAQVGLVLVLVCLVVGAAIAIETVAESIIQPAAALRRGLE